MMGCEHLFYSLLLAFTIALITYNILATTSVVHQNDELDDTDPIIKMPYEKRLFHTFVTATNSSYNKWKCRIMYYWHKQLSRKVGLDMVGFTRFLHSGRPDNLMDEMPTFVVDPLPSGLDHVCAQCFNFSFSIYRILKSRWVESQWIYWLDFFFNY